MAKISTPIDPRTAELAAVTPTTEWKGAHVPAPGKQKAITPYRAIVYGIEAGRRWSDSAEDRFLRGLLEMDPLDAGATVTASLEAESLIRTRLEIRGDIDPLLAEIVGQLRLMVLAHGLDAPKA